MSDAEAPHQELEPTTPPKEEGILVDEAESSPMAADQHESPAAPPAPPAATAAPTETKPVPTESVENDAASTPGATSTNAPKATTVRPVVPPVALQKQGGGPVQHDPNGPLVQLESPRQPGRLSPMSRSARSMSGSKSPFRSPRSPREGEITIMSVREELAEKHAAVNDLRRDVARTQTAAIDVLGKAAYAATFALTEDGKVIPASHLKANSTSPVRTPRLTARETAAREMGYGITVLESPEFMKEVPDPVHSAKAAKASIQRAKYPSGVAAQKALAALKAQDERMHTTIPSEYIRKQRGDPTRRMTTPRVVVE